MTKLFNESRYLALQKHGFFGRVGGISKGVFTSLNCSQSSGDAPESVRHNRSTVAREMGLSTDNVLSLHQIHSATVVNIDGPAWQGNRPEGDAMVTGLAGVGLGIVTADCAPVLFSDPKARIIGAAHAGWKGALNGIVGATIDAMIGLGASRNDISATIGPCISQQAYEVGQEFLETFLDQDRRNSQFFINGKQSKFQFDLPMFVNSCLKDQGISNSGWVNICTYADENKYFSYRRTTHNQETDYGRQLSVITNSFH